MAKQQYPLTRIFANKIGTDKTGDNASSLSTSGSSQPLGNALDGILLNDVGYVTIGVDPNFYDSKAHAISPNANVISGNLGRGIEIRGGSHDIPGNLVEGNIIGLNSSGTSPLDSHNNSMGNLGDGIFLLNATPNTIIGNLISSNRAAGVHAKQDDHSIVFGEVVVTGNMIGTNYDGTGIQDSRSQPDWKRLRRDLPRFTARTRGRVNRGEDRRQRHCRQPRQRNRSAPVESHRDTAEPDWYGQYGGRE